METSPRGAWELEGEEPTTCPMASPQALVDDTEDVSLDFGNEEELALRKAKIRYVWASVA